MRLALLFAACLTTIASCTPSVRVTKNPDDCETGLRYYRPKPYLMVTPGGQTQTVDKTTTVTPSDQFVNLDIKYLPDFSEEYAIKVNPGLGVANVTIALQDGWNLTSINQTLDTKFADNLNAVANLVGKAAPGGLIKTSEDAGGGDQRIGTVPARNVPIGLYESVIGVDPCGRKQLYGWRYVGFAPFNTCPLYPTGAESACCNDGTLDLYGLVFENGVMLFKPLLKVRDISTAEASRRLEIVGPAGAAQPPAHAPPAPPADPIAVLKADLKQKFTKFVDLRVSSAVDLNLVVELSAKLTDDEKTAFKAHVVKYLTDNDETRTPKFLFRVCTTE